MDEKFVTVDGNRIRYLDSGPSGRDGPPLVLIHGLGASAERWDLAAPTLRKHFHLIVPDLVGFGHSDKPVADYTPEFFAAFLGGFFERLDIKRPLLIGSSLGGHIAIEYCCRPPPRGEDYAVRRLVLVSPAGIMKTSTPALDGYIMAALYPNIEGVKSAFQIMTSSPDEEVPPHVVDGFVRRMRMPNAKMAFMSSLLGMKNAPVITPKLRSIGVPTLVVWGQHDPVIPITHADLFVSSIQDCRFLRMDNCGHTPYVEDPKGFCRAVLGFLRQ